MSMQETVELSGIHPKSNLIVMMDRKLDSRIVHDLA